MFGYLFSEMLLIGRKSLLIIQYEFLNDAIFVRNPDAPQSMDQVKSKSSQVITPAD